MSKFLEMPTISAEVTRVTSDKLLRENPVYAEFLRFYDATGICDIECSNKGAYNEIAELAGADLNSRWPDELISSLKTAYWKFSETYDELQGRESELLTGDAFLIYLRIFIRDALGNYSAKVVEKRIARIKKELMTERSSDKVALGESADDVLNAGSIISKTGTAVSKVIPSLSYTPKHPLKAAFIYDNKISESNWTADHERGRLKLEKAYGGSVITSCHENSDSPAKFEKAVSQAAAWGSEVVFTTSPRQINDALRAAIQYKDIKFLNCSIYLAHQAVRTYYAKHIRFMPNQTASCSISITAAAWMTPI